MSLAKEWEKVEKELLRVISADFGYNFDYIQMEPSGDQRSRGSNG